MGKGRIENTLNEGAGVPKCSQPRVHMAGDLTTFLWTSALMAWSWLTLNSVFTLAQDHLLSSELLPKALLSKFKVEMTFLILYFPSGSQDCSQKLSYLRRSL